MQSKNAIRFVAILLAIACLWQLSFTAVTMRQENKAEKYAAAAVEAAQQSAAFAKVSDADKASFEAETLYIQSFMDLLLDYVATEGNSLRGFLKRWAEDKSNISCLMNNEGSHTLEKPRCIALPSSFI